MQRDFNAMLDFPKLDIQKSDNNLRLLWILHAVTNYEKKYVKLFSSNRLMRNFNCFF